jgi:hypothetical protein
MSVLELHTMQIRARLLTISLLAVACCAPTVIGQQPGTVNVRPRVATAQPGVPSVKVNVDRNRVPLGDEVTFTIAPESESVVRDFTVTIYFGDKDKFGNLEKQEVHQTEIVQHLYTAPGNYTYSVLVKPSAPRDPVSNKTPVPGVKLIVNPPTVATRTPVNFTAQPSHNYPNIQYRFVFADGAQTDWQDAPQTTHSYATAKTYLAYVDIGEGSRGSAKRIGGSLRQPIQVTAPQNVSVDLLANPASVKTRDTVKFNAQTKSRDPKIKYRFAFGDGAITGWLDSPSTNHKYAVANDYFASVEVGLPSKRTIKTVATSKPAKIGVATRPKPSPTPSPKPSPMPIPSPTPTPIPSSTPTPSPSDTPTPSPDGSPTPSPSTSVSPSPTVSPPLVGGVSPTPSPTPTCGPFSWRDPFGWRCWPWWIPLLIALLLILLAYRAVKFFLLPRPKLVPHLDPGVARVGADKPLSIDLQLALDPNVTGGQYGLDTGGGSLIKSERGSNG